MECFKVNSGDIGKRLDCFYYKPEFVELEKIIKGLSSKTLGDYIRNIAGGATPEKDESEKYYTDSSINGVPFLRVQNITTEGIDFENCKYINLETHNTMLKRSQVKEGYLLTKITGVGRMAISSVAPKGFEGNINQHIVTIKTDSYQTSEVLASFLNSDIGERLAFRRSTGGTRPALDYEALKTIPIVFEPKMFEIMQSAYEQKKQKEQEAEKLLASISEYVLRGLGIKLSDSKNRQCYAVDFREIAERVDPYYYQPRFKSLEKTLADGTFNTVSGKHLFLSIESGKGIKPAFIGNVGIPYIEVKNILPFRIAQTESFIPQEQKSKLLNKGDIITGRVGSIGNFTLVNTTDKIAFSDNVIRIVANNDFNKDYLVAILNSAITKFQLERDKKGSLQDVINQQTLNGLKIPLPPLATQNKIADEVEKRMSEAERLQVNSNRVIEDAKHKVEDLILGKTK